MMIGDYQHTGRQKRSFGADKSGSVGAIFGLSFIPAVLVLGVAVDYQRATVAQSKLQAAAQSAALAVASHSELTQAARQQIALNVAKANLGPAASALSVTISETEPSANKYVVAASGSVATSVMKIARFDSIIVSALASAELGTVSTSTPGGGCVLSLNDSAVDAIWDNGNARVTLANCDLYGNSVNGSALDVSGSAELIGRKVSLAGGVHGANRISATEIKTYQAKVVDPYAKVDLPAFSGCTRTNYATSTNVTLDPGVYCNGLAINSSAEVRLNPGLYVIDQGEFKVNGQAKVTGEGVTIVFTSTSTNVTNRNWAYATINGGAVVDLSAPKDGASGGLPGLVFYGNRAMTNDTKFKLNGGATQKFTGAVYLPEAAIWFTGNATYGSSPTAASGCTQLIGDTITFIGDSSVAISGCDGYSLNSFGSITSTTTSTRLIQ